MKTLRPLLLFISLLLIVGLACSFDGGAEASPPSPTQQQEPTQPSPTLEPTVTPKPTATSTPDAEATKAFESTKQAEDLITDIQEQLRSLELPTDTGRLEWYQTKSQSIKLRAYNETSYLPFATDLSASDFVVRSRITWITNGWMTCGLKFRSEPNIDQGKQYEFDILRLSGLPAWAIDFRKDGSYVNTPTDVRFSDEIDSSDGAEHEVILVIEGEKFVVFINGVSQGRYFDYSTQAKEGYFAFSAWQNSGESTCTFEDSWVWLLK